MENSDFQMSFKVMKETFKTIQGDLNELIINDNVNALGNYLRQREFITLIQMPIICLTSVKLSIVAKSVDYYRLSFPPPHCVDREILSMKE
jgi:hypothetical protein